MSSDDDWFEQALDEADDPPADAEEQAESTGEDGESDPPSGGTDDATASADPADADSAGRSVVDTPAEDSPFSEDFSAAFNRAPDPGSDGDGEMMAESQPGQPGQQQPGQQRQGAFEDEGDDAFGGFDDVGFAASDFDEEEFESALDRLDIGIDGLDEMILGGIPRQSLIATIGSAGTGKTTIGMQFLHEALANGERAVYITLEESRERVLDTAEEKGWPFREFEEDGTLAIVDLDPIEMANSLSSIRNDLTRLIDDYGAERLVLDSVSLLEMMYDHPARRRSEVFQFSRALKKAGVTTLVTSEASDTDPFASRHGIIEYLADAVLILQYVRSNNFQETRLAIEIQKIRDANHSRQPKPYEITNEGISVHQQANLF